jgi:membrane protease YdiL (CAAX protease family)
MKGIFANRSALFQAVVLVYLFLTGLTAAAVAGGIINHLFAGTIHRLFYQIQVSQFFSCILSFLLPAIFTAYFCSHHPKNFLHIFVLQNVRTFVLIFLMVIFLLPVIELTAYLNAKIQLPEFMSPLENLMRETEDKLTQVTDSLLTEKGAIPFTVNIIVIAVMAGITEEFMFRGAALSIARKKIKNLHAAIWIVAALFSAIHFQFYGFVPRLLLGAFFGYLLYWCKNIWAPVFAHFLHNAIAVTASYTGLSTDIPNETAFGEKNMDSGDWMIAVIIAATGLFLFALCAKSMKKHCQQRESEKQDNSLKTFSYEAQNHDPDIFREQSR